MTIERFEIAIGPFTYQARRAGPKTGRPVILLHGVPQTSACWTSQLEALANAGYHAVAYTQRGYSPGARVDDVKAFTMDKMMGDVLAVADKLGYDKFDVVGHDMGAGVAWALATFHPARIRSLSALSVPHPNAYADAYNRRIPDEGPGDDQYDRSAYARNFKNMPRGEPERAFVANDCAQLRASHKGLPEDHAAEYLELLGSVEAMRGVLDVYRNSSLFNDGPGKGGAGNPLPPITVPTLFIWSDQDIAIASAGAYATGDHINAPYRFVVARGVDHWIPEKAPDLVNKELLAHLASS